MLKVEIQMDGVYLLIVIIGIAQLINQQYQAGFWGQMLKLIFNIIRNAKNVDILGLGDTELGDGIVAVMAHTSLNVVENNF